MYSRTQKYGFINSKAKHYFSDGQGTPGALRDPLPIIPAGRLLAFVQHPASGFEPSTDFICSLGALRVDCRKRARRQITEGD